MLSPTLGKWYEPWPMGQGSQGTGFLTALGPQTPGCWTLLPTRSWNVRASRFQTDHGSSYVISSFQCEICCPCHAGDVNDTRGMFQWARKTTLWSQRRSKSTKYSCAQLTGRSAQSWRAQDGIEAGETVSCVACFQSKHKHCKKYSDPETQRQWAVFRCEQTDSELRSLQPKPLTEYLTVHSVVPVQYVHAHFVVFCVIATYSACCVWHVVRANF